MPEPLRAPGAPGTVRPGLPMLFAVALLPLVLLAVGTLLLLHAGPRLVESLAARSWPQAQGRVVGAELVEVDPGGDGSGGEGRYEVRIRYAFEAAGGTWEGGRDGIWQDLRPLEPARERLAAFPAGTPVRVWYHPQDPRRALLDPMVGTGTWTMVLASAPLLALGLVMSIGFVRGVRRG